MRRVILFVVGILLFTSGMTQNVAADAIIRIGRSKGFRRAVQNGRIQAVDPAGTDARNQSNLGALGKVFPGQDAQFRNTQLSIDEPTIDGLVSATGSNADLNSEIIGAWNYAYPTDPDISSVAIHLELFFPEVGAVGFPGVNTFALAVIDALDNVRLWRWDDTALTVGSQTFDLNLFDGLGAGGSTSFFEDPGFDPTTAIYLQVSYRGLLTGSFPPTPDGSIALWTGTSKTATRFTPPVVPEPGSLAVFLLGTIGLAAWRLTKPTV